MHSFDESSCDASTGPTTSNDSSLLAASKTDESQHFNSSSYLEAGEFDLSEDGLINSRSANHFDRTVAKTVRNICVVGAGYVGGPTAAVIALHNPSIRVEVLDRDQCRIARWKSSHLPIYEPGLSKVVRVARDGAYILDHDGQDPVSYGGLDVDKDLSTSKQPSKRPGNLFFTSDTYESIYQADLIFLAVATPTKTFGVGAGKATNMCALDEVVKELATYAKPGTILVEKSTIPCGTARRIRNILNALRPGTPFEILSNPEFLSEGTAVENLMNPDRVIIGSSGKPSGRLAAASLTTVYASWIPTSKIIEINVWSAELSKLVANAMLAQRISSINSISAICDATGADIDEIAESVGLDSRIGPQVLKAGLGFGGSCLRKDLSSLTYLAESLGLYDVAHYWNQVNVMNERQLRRFTEKVVYRFDENLTGKKIAFLGFAFKKNIGDTRGSLAVEVMRDLLRERPEKVSIFDPYCKHEDILREVEHLCGSSYTSTGFSSNVEVTNDVYQACSQATAILIISDYDQFRYPVAEAEDKKAQPQKAGDMVNIFETNRSTLEINCLSIGKPSSSLHLRTEANISVSNRLSLTLVPQPECAVQCPDCALASDNAFTSSSSPSSFEPLDWKRIADHMEEPKWAFDGRGILNIAGMWKLGIRVDTFGRQS